MRNASRKHHDGFTLIEILVVLVIIGIMVVGAVLSTGVAHGDRDLENERDRIMVITGHLRDLAALQNREYGMRCYEGGYEFVVFDPREGLWLRDPEETTMNAHRFPPDLEVQLYVEGRRVELPDADVRPDELAPQIMLYSSGDLSLFELTIRRGEDGPGVSFAPSPAFDGIEATEIEDEAS